MAYLLGLFLGLVLGAAVASALAAVLIAERYPQQRTNAINADTPLTFDQIQASDRAPARLLPAEPFDAGPYLHQATQPGLRP